MVKMNTYAHIINGIVAEPLFIPQDGFTIEQCFSRELTWVDVTGIVPSPQEGWTAVEAAGKWTFAEPPAPPGPTPPQAAAAALSIALAKGIAITSASMPTINGTYALDAVSTGKIFQIGVYANQFGVFPSGGATQEYPDLASGLHTFSVQVFVAFLRAVAPMVAALEAQASIMAQGGTPTWPSQAATIV
jgi:hypothetical protein